MVSTFRPTIIALAIGFSLAGFAASPAKRGSICVAPLPSNAKEMDHDYPGGRAPREYTYHFAVRVDDREAVLVSQHGAFRIADLEVGMKHHVRINDGARSIESFWFTFEARKSRSLCLSYGPWYQTWSLEDSRKGLKCGCS
jgi:hypothetical protein